MKGSHYCTFTSLCLFINNLNKEVRSDEKKLADDIMLFTEGKKRCGWEELQKDLSILGAQLPTLILYDMGAILTVLAQDLTETHALLKPQ